MSRADYLRKQLITIQSELAAIEVEERMQKSKSLLGI